MGVLEQGRRITPADISQAQDSLVYFTVLLEPGERFSYDPAIAERAMGLVGQRLHPRMPLPLRVLGETTRVGEEIIEHVDEL